jgi:hydroxymethylpyrimidine/phosphomethylpyrimidine kinase
MADKVKRALTIAGSDSGGGAGVQADLKTFAAHGVYGSSAITAVTAQNTVGVTGMHTLPADFVTAQIEAVMSDIGADAAKTGMLASAAIVEAVAAAVADLDIPKLVVDPVMVSKGGHRLVDEEAVGAIEAELLPRAYVVTPNRHEAERLARMEIDSIVAAREAARRLHRLGPAIVIVKGGHLPGERAVDLVFDGRVYHELTAARLLTANTHGTGCTFAAAIAANLALGFGPLDAAQRAKAYVTEAIRHGLAIGSGHGPLDHFWRWRGQPAVPDEVHRP